MTQEIIYTSARKGLRVGSRGFCTVASTTGMSKSLAECLESLSAYKHLYAPNSPEAKLNPVNFSCVQAQIGGQPFHIVSRIADAGLDYTQRTNKIAHHVALEPRELLPTGPAWLLSQPGFIETEWSGEARLFPSGKVLPSGDLQPGICNTWKSMTGDAGWGGILAQSIQQNTGHAVLIFKPGMNLLPLILESQALLPKQQRWKATFSTYFTRMSPGIECRWRCILAGTPEARSALRNPSITTIDLCSPLGQAADSPMVESARTGVIATPERLKPSPVESAAAPVPKQPAAKQVHSPMVSAASQESGAPPTLPPIRGNQNPFDSSVRPLRGEPIAFTDGKKKRLIKKLFLGLAALVLVSFIGVGGYLGLTAFVKNDGKEIAQREKVDPPKPVVVEKTKAEEEAKEKPEKKVEVVGDNTEKLKDDKENTTSDETGTAQEVSNKGNTSPANPPGDESTPKTDPPMNQGDTFLEPHVNIIESAIGSDCWLGVINNSNILRFSILGDGISSIKKLAISSESSSVSQWTIKSIDPEYDIATIRNDDSNLVLRYAESIEFAEGKIKAKNKQAKIHAELLANCFLQVKYKEGNKNPEQSHIISLRLPTTRKAFNLNEFQQKQKKMTGTIQVPVDLGKGKVLGVSIYVQGLNHSNSKKSKFNFIILPDKTFPKEVAKKQSFKIPFGPMSQTRQTLELTMKPGISMEGEINFRYKFLIYPIVDDRKSKQGRAPSIAWLDNKKNTGFIKKLSERDKIDIEINRLEIKKRDRNAEIEKTSGETKKNKEKEVSEIKGTLQVKSKERGRLQAEIKEEYPNLSKQYPVLNKQKIFLNNLPETFKLHVKVERILKVGKEGKEVRVLVYKAGNVDEK